MAPTNINRRRIDYSRRFLTAALLAWVFIQTGCFDKTVLQKPPDEIAPAPPPGFSELLAAEAAFAEGRHEAAKKLFAAIVADGYADAVRCRAQYGLVCSRLASAKSSKTIEDAIDAWGAWKRASAKGCPQEDPRMLGPFIDHYTTRAEEIQATFRREVRKLKSQLRQKTAEIESLKAKLEQIETIHTTIQEKKRQVTQP